MLTTNKSGKQSAFNPRFIARLEAGQDGSDITFMDILSNGKIASWTVYEPLDGILSKLDKY